MRGAWGTLTAIGGFLIVAGIVVLMASNYVDHTGSLVTDPRGQMTGVMVTMARMRTLIGQLQLR